MKIKKFYMIFKKKLYFLIILFENYKENLFNVKMKTNFLILKRLKIKII